MRADVFLYSHGFAKSRTHASELIKSGVLVCGKKISKPSTDIPGNTSAEDIKITNPSKYVSRGGLKLEAALAVFNLKTDGITALDIGASTGGFTDCLLQHGAKKVYAVDVGHGQLDPSLANDDRVVNLEGINARSMTAYMIGRGDFPLAVSDVSFISQSLIYDSVRALLSENGIFVSLIKPQFECGKQNLASGGICKDKKIHIKVISELLQSAQNAGLFPVALTRSPITGGDGNTEYLVCLAKNNESKVSDEDIKRCVMEGQK
ncbi:MAG: TlyA family RNA methyltransferase [Clostridia bacterium]|nr:TlyA family RNA methyltransferase [Clostridia bacterium]